MSEPIVIDEPVEVFNEAYNYEDNREVSSVRVTITYRRRELIPNSLFASASYAAALVHLRKAIETVERCYDELVEMERKAAANA